MAEVWSAEVVRCHDEVESTQKMLYLAMAGKHPHKLSIYVCTLSLYQIFGQVYVHTIGPLKKRLRAAAAIPEAHYAVGRIWARAFQHFQLLDVPKEIETFVNTLPETRGAGHLDVPKQPDPEELKILQQAAMMFATEDNPTPDITKIPHWVFSTDPWTPETSPRNDPFKGDTHTCRFGTLCAQTLEAIYFLMQADCSVDTATRIHNTFLREWPPIKKDHLTE